MGFVLTNAGIAARNTIISTGVGHAFTRAAVGTGMSVTPPEEMTDLVSFEMNIEVKQSIVAAPTQQFEVLIDNSTVTTAFVAAEIGVYLQIAGQAEILYARCEPEGGIYVPAQPSVMVHNEVFDTTISATSDVTINVDFTVAYATVSDLLALQARVSRNEDYIAALIQFVGIIATADVLINISHGLGPNFLRVFRDALLNVTMYTSGFWGIQTGGNPTFFITLPEGFWPQSDVAATVNVGGYAGSSTWVDTTGTINISSMDGGVWVTAPTLSEIWAIDFRGVSFTAAT